MAIDCYQLREYIVRPSLSAIGLWSDDAMYLVLGTCAQESGFGTYLVQGKTLDRQDALGIYQQEKLGYDELWDAYVQRSAPMRAKVRLYLGYEGKPPFQRLISDNALATIMCRLFYVRVKEPLPNYKDLPAMAAYYKKYYNTKYGAATESQFIENYRRFIK